MFTTIWPLFALILTGHLLRRARFPTETYWPAADRLNYFVLFPALLLANLSEAPLDDPAILTLGGTIVAVILVAFAACWAFRAVSRWPAARFGVLVQSMVRFNTFIGLALAASLYGPEGVARAAVLLAIAVPTVNILSVVALTAEEGAPSLRTLLRPIVTNPLILACFGGIALALSGIGLPYGLERFMDLAAGASLPLGLLSVGAALDPGALRADTRPLLAVSLLRLLAMPALGFAAAWAAGLTGATAGVLIIFTAIPTATASYVLTGQLGGDYRLMAGMITLQTLISAAVLPVTIGFYT